MGVRVPSSAPNVKKRVVVSNIEDQENPMATVAGRTSTYGFIFWVGLAIVGSYFVWPLKQHLKLGTDLIGGFYITLQVQTDEAVKAEMIERMRGAVVRLKEQGVAPVSQKVEGHSFSLTFPTTDEAQKAARFLKSHGDGFAVHNDEGTVVVATLPEHVVKQIKDWAVQSNIDVLRRRLDKTGVAEVAISRQGDKGIVIELPNVDDPARAKEMIGRTAQFEIKLIEDMGSSEEEILEKYNYALPEGTMIIPGSQERKGHTAYYLVPDYTDLTGRDLKNTEPALGGMTGTEPVVTFEFRPDGGDKMYELTSKNQGRQLAFIVDGEVISAAVIRSTIHSSGSISGTFTYEEVQDLAIAFKSGSFVAPVKFEEERRIGPSLGEESIRQGLMSCLIGMSLLFLFSVIVYKASGLLAFVALLYNLLLTLFCLCWLQATLTLPGIAGMLLTVGTAIDCSILIFERVREALRAGMSFKNAIEVGFSDVWVIILDANLTTLLMSIVLYKFGTGPIKGFAVTMMFGIGSTLITGLLFLRSMFGFILTNTRIGKLSI